MQEEVCRTEQNTNSSTPPRNGRRFSTHPRPPQGNSDLQSQQVTLRLDREVIACLRASDPGWQTRVNEQLRRMVEL